MTGKPLVILASARKESDTGFFLKKVLAGQEYTTIDLLDYSIAPYTYTNNYPEKDQFTEVADAMLKHEAIIFATPVYWYTMSGLMKTLFDRFTDLITVKKQLGRLLSGKTTLLLAVGADKELPPYFETPFSATSAYFNMRYEGCIYHSIKYPEKEAGLQKAINLFTKNLKKPFS